MPSQLTDAVTHFHLSCVGVILKLASQLMAWERTSTVSVLSVFLKYIFSLLMRGENHGIIFCLAAEAIEATDARASRRNFGEIVRL